MYLPITSLFLLSITTLSHCLRGPGHLQIRQFTSQCASVCDFLTPLSTCQRNDIQCECSIVVTGSVRSCAECLSTFNITQAEAILELGTECLTASLSPTASPTTTFSTSVDAAECASACEQYDNYVICASEDLACSCSAILGYGPLCSYCGLMSDQQPAAGTLISDCFVLSHEGFPPYTSSSTSSAPITTNLEPSTVASHAISLASATATSSSAAVVRANQAPKWWDGFFVIVGLFVVFI